MLFYLCGFMGSGKTYLLNKLRRKFLSKKDISWSFIDLDEIIYTSNGFDSINQMVSQKGWNFFRRKELDHILKINSNSGQSNMVVALGGGALCQDVLDVINSSKDCYLVWHNTSFELCYQRIAGDQNRPLVRKGKEFLSKLFKERLSDYMHADIHLTEEEQNNINEIDQLVQKVKNLGQG